MRWLGRERAIRPSSAACLYDYCRLEKPAYLTDDERAFTMTIITQLLARRSARQKISKALPTVLFKSKQHGVVLIIALVLLVIISLLAVVSVRNAGSNEAVAGNVRTVELATEAAEIALRHCEASVLKISGGTDTYTTTFTAANIADTGTPTQWQSMGNWDANGSAVYVLPLSLLNQTDMLTTYKRPSECMVEKMPSASSGGSALYVITVRGFGPEVTAADTPRTRPNGTEIWLQSHIEIQ